MVVDGLLSIGYHQSQILLQIAWEFVKLEVIENIAQIQEIIRCSVAKETVQEQVASTDQNSNKCGTSFHAWITH